MQKITYTTKLKKLTFSEIIFTTLEINEIKPVFNNNRGEPDKKGFKQLLLALFSDAIGKKVMKYMLLFTPKQPSYDSLGFLYIEDKTIVPIKVQPSENYKAWSAIITKGNAFFKQDIMDWLIIYSDKTDEGKGMSHEFEGKYYGIEDREIYTETGLFLYEQAPKKFNLKKIASEKKRYLKKYLQLDALNSPLTEAIPLAFDTHPPAKDIAAFCTTFEQTTAMPFPKSLEQLYSQCDGSKETLASGYKLMSRDEVLAAWTSWKAIYDDWLLEELKVHQTDGNKTLPMYVTPYWIPFMTDDNGNYVALDFAPAKKGVAGQVIVFGADEQQIKVLGSDVASFLNSLGKEDNALRRHLG